MVRLAGFVLGSIGLLLGLGVVWTQLARALPLAALLHHPRALRAMLFTGAGLGLLLVGRLAGGSRSRSGRLPATWLLVVVAALMAFGAGQALAVDATGTWSGKGTCRQKAKSSVTRTRQRHSTMFVTQRGEALFVEIDGTAYQGLSHDSERNPTRAAGSAVRCRDFDEACTPTSEVLDLKIRVNETRGTTKIGAESTVPHTRHARHCTYRFSRTSREDPGVAPPVGEAFCGDGVVNDALNEECDGTATGTPCDGACTGACTCPRPCAPLDVSGHWDGTWVSEVTGESGEVVADLGQMGEFALGTISFPPFSDAVYSAPLVVVGACAPSEFSTGAALRSGMVGTLEGIATNDSLAGTWGLSDHSDSGTWQLSR
jgi:hypothetical protein